VHGLDDWMYPNSKYNPHCPLIPGCADSDVFARWPPAPVDLESEQIWRTIVRLIDHAHCSTSASTSGLGHVTHEGRVVSARCKGNGADHVVLRFVMSNRVLTMRFYFMVWCRKKYMGEGNMDERLGTKRRVRIMLANNLVVSNKNAN